MKASYERTAEKAFDLPPIAKDEDGTLYWVQHWHLLPSGITLEQFTRKVIRDHLEKLKRWQELENFVKKFNLNTKDPFVRLAFTERGYYRNGETQ
jgi:hypothetical protein